MSADRDRSPEAPQFPSWSEDEVKALGLGLLYFGLVCGFALGVLLTLLVRAA